MKTTSSGLVSKISRLIVFLIIISFVLTPLAPVFAQEAETSTPTTEEAPAAETSSSPSTGEVLGTEAPEATSREESAPKEKEKKDKKIKDEKVQALASSVTTPTGSLASIADSSGLKLVPSVDNTTGALVYKYPIIVPPGRNGLTPDISLVYNSATAMRDSIVGAGWSIDIPYIERVNKDGTNNLYSESYFASSLDGELVSLGSGNYGAKDESGSFNKYSLASNVWTVTDKNGTVYKFGTNAAERQDNSADTSKVFEWMLQEVRDTNDNYIKYEYYKDTGQIYPSKITYTGNGSTDGILEVNFDRSSRSNAPKSYATGFSVQSNYRITEIRTEVSDVWARKYTLSYTTADNGTGSLLDTIIESGQDDSFVVTTLPAIDFNYNTAATDWTYDSSWTLELPFTYSAGKDSGTRLGDINGDGLLDMVCHNVPNSPCGPAQVYLNDGDGTWTDVSSTWLFPVEVNDPNQQQEAFLLGNSSGTSYEDRGLRLFDINGDGLADLVRGGGDGGGTYKYVYLNTGSGWTYDSSWTLEYAFLSNAVSGKDYGMRMSDINGDDLPDIVSPQIFLNNGVGGWTDVSTTWMLPLMANDSSSTETFVDSSYADRGLRLFDINGDGLTDLVRGASDGGGTYKYVYLNNESTDANLLTQITYPEGGNTSVTYKGSA